MMNNPLDQLFDISREWVSLPRASDVARVAVSFLRSTFQIDAGLVSYSRHPQKNGIDYLRKPLRWFLSWGYETPELELRRAIAASRDFTEEMRQRHWFAPEDVPSVWQAINERHQIKEIGIWIIQFQGEPVGVFVLTRKSAGQGDHQDISRCMAYIGVLIEMVITRRLAEELSIRDPLTGILNRRGLLSRFDRLVGAGQALTVAVIDLDGFKQYNDQHGHVAGDGLLTRVADVLTSHAEAYQGMCARMGGDEFVILAPYVFQSPQRAAQTIAGWLMKEGIPASVGCAAIGVDGDDFDTCYGVADHRLYDMKLAARS